MSQGQFYLYPLVAAALTPKEQTVATMLVNGSGTGRIARALGFSNRGYTFQCIKNIAHKLGLPRDAGYVRVAVELFRWSEWHVFQ